MNGSGAIRFVLATGVISRMRGLLGTRGDWGDGGSVLLLHPCASVHTLGMRYAIDVAFCDKHGMVLRSEENVRPGRLLLCTASAFVLERPHADDIAWLNRGETVPVCLHGARHAKVL